MYSTYTFQLESKYHVQGMGDVVWERHVVLHITQVRGAGPGPQAWLGRGAAAPPPQGKQNTRMQILTRH